MAPIAARKCFLTLLPASASFVVGSRRDFSSFRPSMLNWNCRKSPRLPRSSMALSDVKHPFSPALRTSPLSRRPTVCSTAPLPSRTSRLMRSLLPRNVTGSPTYRGSVCESCVSGIQRSHLASSPGSMQSKEMLRRVFPPLRKETVSVRRRIHSAWPSNMYRAALPLLSLRFFHAMGALQSTKIIRGAGGETGARGFPGRCGVHGRV